MTFCCGGKQFIKYRERHKSIIIVSLLETKKTERPITKF